MVFEVIVGTAATVFNIGCMLLYRPSNDSNRYYRDEETRK